MANLIRFVAERLVKLRAQVPYVPRALALVWAAAKVWTVVSLVLLVLQGLLPVATVYLTKALVDSLVGVIKGAADVRTTLILAVAMGVVMLLDEALKAAGTWVRTAQSELVQDHIQAIIHEKATTVDLAFYDLPEYFDHLHRAKADASYRPIELIEAMGGLLQSSITLIAMGVVLLRFGVWLPLLLLIGTAPAFLVVLRHTVRQHEWRRRRTPEERRAWYYDWLLTSRAPAPEIRLFGLAAHFKTSYREVRRKLRTERLELIRQQGIAKLIAGVAGLAVMGATTLWMVWQAVQRKITLGDLALFYQAFNQGLRLMRSLLEQLGQLYTNILFLRNLFEYLELEPQIVDPPSPAEAAAELRGEIRLTGVRFRYPGNDRWVLDGLDLTVRAGQVAAIVGPNGTGKSTLIRLLCRFYDPADGRIEFDGVDLREMRLEDLRRRITALFQEPVHYNATAGENIGLGDLSAPPDGRLERAAEAAGADEIVRRLPGGYEALLGRWFVDGSELSVGEWQRLALARGYYRDAPIMVLDEPTSAMDPWAEQEWMRRFKEAAGQRTAIIMTHRLTTAMLADVVYVIKDGRVVESGTHEQLLAAGGAYRDAWTSRGLA